MPKFPLLVFFHPRSSYENLIETLIQAIPEAIKRKKTKVYHSLPMSYGELLSVLIQNYEISVIPVRPRDLHIQKDMMAMPYMNTMEEWEDISWRIARPSKIRFNPWSTQIRSDLENSSMVIRSIMIKDQLGAVFFLFVFWSWMFSFVNMLFEKCKPCFNVSMCMK